ILEKSGEAGGRGKTINEDGIGLDLGFQVLLSAYPLANKYLDMDALELTQLESGALIYANGKSYQIGDPLRNWKMFLPTILANVGTVGDKFKILSLNSRLKNKSIEEIFDSPETSTMEYLKQFGFSSKMINRFFRPFFAGIFLEPELRTSSRMFEFVYKMFGEGYATIPKLGIGEISKQLQDKLQRTQFLFNQEVKEVKSDAIVMADGEEKPHDGVIIATGTTSLVANMSNQEVDWKSCMCLYFEVDSTNIPEGTIALIADAGNLSNNLYAFKDHSSGQTILSVTSLEYKGMSEKDITSTIISEVKEYTGASKVKHLKNYRIDHALPDINQLRTTTHPSESRLLDSVYLAGDHLFNGSLNAAMESGRLAALAVVEKA
ncbi:MAG: FAD-dependent oxidoreductase, partial [Flavobacteriales bacterium]|nr:FAD-dependent oxidoreductase [Flavobacteriales bacterium]